MSLRHSQSSPSVTMEKGTYRISRPPPRSPKWRTGRRESRNALSNQEIRLGLLVLTLLVATLFSFGVAYFLYSTRCDKCRSKAINSSNDQSEFQVLDFDPELTNQTIDPSDKFLSYLPHSGFHNQRIAFENALVLARLLNRTLLAPPARLGSAPITYFPSSILHTMLGDSYKAGLRDCAEVNSWTTIPVHCHDYFDFTVLPWGWLSNLTAIGHEQKVIWRWNMSDSWLSDVLGIRKKETYTLGDDSLYQYRFVDADPLEKPNHRYEHTVTISLLSQVSHKLLEIGTLFGSSRLRLRKPKNLKLRKEIRESMAFSNDVLLRMADSMITKMGGQHIAAHVRLGDGHFQEKGRRNIRMIWWTLLRDGLRLDSSLIAELEANITGHQTTAPPPRITDSKANILPEALEPVVILDLPRIACRGTPMSDERLRILNVPLFISTDVVKPADQPLLRPLFDTFPCTFILSDFAHEMAKLEKLKNGYDGLIMKTFLLPILDAIVAGKAQRLAVTHGSTFSQFVQDVLWRKYHGWEIVERG